ncbi:hypothetical protein LOTGIDRAFT_167626 [Lottia gigantea]|uniref:DNA-directed DNA polymerase n=1 Tax=Lottia gigantea TaxID=225164 RepID=V3ZTM2_LOTGI|nr:hypothetical protein LOTGIDRAFT_167626 [Lottia gigantea]ESO85875.1 hypothetical protein LOTGIDRAFT_167626 [Lottia gigantea]
MELESRQQYMIEKQNELKEKQFNKYRKTWNRIDSVFKTLITVLTVGITVATAVTGEIIFRKNNFRIVKRSKTGRGGNLLKKINEYKGENCFIPSDGNCFIKCVNHFMNKDLTNEFQDFVNSFQKSNRKGVMTSARISEFNKKFNTYFQIYMPKHRHFQPKKVSEELDWVFYLHKEHFCLIRRNNKTLGIKEIENIYDENVWRTCGDDDALTCFAQLKLNVISQPHDDTLYAWDCETYSENKAIPYCCTLVNLEKLRKKLELIKRVFPDLKPTDPIPEEFYNKLMTNIVEIFVGTDCFDQIMRRLGTVDEKRLTLISHNRSGFDNWIALQSINKLTQCPLVTDNKILSLPLSNPYTEERLQKKWKREKGEIKISDKNKYLQNMSSLVPINMKNLVWRHGEIRLIYR